MKKKLINVFLVASLALNLAFITVGVYKHLSKEKKVSPSEYPFPFGNSYGLGEKQKSKLSAVVKEFRVNLAKNNSSILEKRIDIIELLGDPEYKMETLEEELDELNKIERESNTEFVSTLIKINSILESKQWLKFLYDLSKGWFFNGVYVGN